MDECAHLLKQWTDEVFMAFTQEGLIEGKEFMVVTTTGSEEAAYLLYSDTAMHQSKNSNEQWRKTEAVRQ